MIFACERDLKAIASACQADVHPDEADRHTNIKQTWLQVFLSVPTKFRVLETESAKFFASVQARIDIDVERSAVSRKPYQWCMEVVMHRARMHRAIGGRIPPGAEAVAKDLKENLNLKGIDEEEDSSFEPLTKTFVDNCLTVYDRMLKHADCMKLVMRRGRLPWDKVNKLHLLITKAGSRENILFTLELIDDMLTSKVLSNGEVSGKAIKGASDNPSMANFMLAKRTLVNKLTEEALRKYTPGWQPDALGRMQKVFASAPAFRAAMESLTWQRDMTQSQLRFVDLLENVLVGAKYDKSCASS